MKIEYLSLIIIFMLFITFFNILPGFVVIYVKDAQEGALIFICYTTVSHTLEWTSV